MLCGLEGEVADSGEEGSESSALGRLVEITRGEGFERVRAARKEFEREEREEGGLEDWN
jgi:hypothetical protein